MKRWTMRLWLLMTVVVLAACSDDDYHYPSVKLEFLTARSDAQGRLAQVTTDNGETYAVKQDDSNLKVGADSTLRIVSQYELLAEGVRLYAVGSSVSPQPVTADAFKEGVVTDPVEPVSIWKGWQYLNLMVQVREPQGVHRFHFVEKKFEQGELHLLLYHKAENYTQAYHQRVYLSIPLAGYLSRMESDDLQVSLTIQTYEGEITQTFHYHKQP